MPETIFNSTTTMRKITLIRTHKAGLAVTGELSFDMLNRHYETETFAQPTLENADFLIPPGTYPIEVTWSPKFKKFLPEIKDVPERSGIRIHMGSKPEHSKGCILLDLAGMSNINCLFNQLEDQDEEAQIEIMEHFAL